MRNSALKDLRSEWLDSRFFFGKTKVMAKALGVDASDEVLEDISLLSKRLTGQVGLLFTSRAPEVVIEAVKAFAVPDYARTGNLATETIVVPEGPVFRGVDPFPHNMEAQLRKLGMPTNLKKGVVTLIRDYEICHEGKPLSSSQSQLLVRWDRSP
jgi:mRNA turnover protein 4